MRLIRLTSHPHDPAIVLLHTPPEMATDMGRFEAARYAPDQRAYLIHAGTLTALHRFAKHINAHVVDERRSDGPRALPHECGSCGQPGSVERPPKFCPACGEDWRPVTYEDVAPTLAQGTCARCGHRQGGRFPRCSCCGGAMTYPEPGRRVELPRVKLHDPMPLSEAMAETVDQLEARHDPRRAPTQAGTTTEET